MFCYFTVETVQFTSKGKLYMKAMSLFFSSSIRVPVFQGDFNFASVYGESKGSGSEREICGRNLLKTLSADNTFDVSNMFEVLRDEDSGICRKLGDPFPTTGSQVRQHLNGNMLISSSLAGVLHL